jgi:hypothetical protein
VYEALKDRVRGAAAAAAAAARVDGGASAGASARVLSIEPSTLERLLCGGIAGFAGQAAAYPLDIVRRALPAQGLRGAAESEAATPPFG